MRGNTYQQEGIPDEKTTTIRVFDVDKEFFNLNAFGASHTAPLALRKIKRIIELIKIREPEVYDKAEKEVVKRMKEEADQVRLQKFGHVDGSAGLDKTEGDKSV